MVELAGQVVVVVVEVPTEQALVAVEVEAMRELEEIMVSIQVLPEVAARLVQPEETRRLLLCSSVWVAPVVAEALEALEVVRLREVVIRTIQVTGDAVETAEGVGVAVLEVPEEELYL